MLGGWGEVKSVFKGGRGWEGGVEGGVRGGGGGLECTQKASCWS